ncbi:MAG: crossover junction endodeoxyribonuclease RuvC [Planctomycetia bacterium]|nr:crossover junction endodeoxyribonuclease RuvC [Planctomycetia bacterium]
MTAEKIILGVDPGLHTTGYGVLEIRSGKVRLLEAGIVRSSAKTLALRIRDIYQGIAEVIDAFHPEVLSLEDLYSLYERPKTAILMGHARGAICLAAALADIPVIPYAATKIKKILTGNGRAPKDQMQRAIQMELHLDTYPDPPDVADALAIALCHYYSTLADPV